MALALAPLALITLLAGLGAARAGDSERRLLIISAAREASHRLAASLLADEDIVRRPLRTAPLSTMLPLERADVCDAAKRALIAGKENAPDSYFLQTGTGADLCNASFDRNRLLLDGPSLRKPGVTIDERSGGIRNVILTQDASGNSISVLLVYPRALLAQNTEPSAQLPPFSLSIEKGDAAIAIRDTLGTYLPGADLTASAQVGNTDLDLRITTMRRSASTADILSVLTPVAMWLLAAGLGWVLMNYLMLRPLKRLDTTLRHYEPGQLIGPQDGIGIHAAEITGLHSAVAKLSEEVAADKEALRRLYDHQVVLTREVHHRVKNNLQIIASLLNIHSRAALTADAEDAYRAIQRRVDALAVVHRNHYAELEDNDGIALRSLLEELAIGLRADDHGRAEISLRADSVRVEQDVAIPVAFMVTECTELALCVSGDNDIDIRIDEQGNTARLSVRSVSFVANSDHDRLWADRFGRVMQGLARQLRKQLDYDPITGVYAIDFPVLHAAPAGPVPPPA